MAPTSNNQLSMKLASFFLKLVGFWISNDSREKWLLDIALTYSIFAVIFANGVTWMDLYYSWHDFYKLAYCLANVMTLLMVGFKLIVFTFKRKKLIGLIKYGKDNFWDAEYDAFGKKILEDCEKKCRLFIVAFTTFAQGTVGSYTISPIIDNIGKNETDRNLPFNIWVDLPVTSTPYFEVFFFIETLSLYHVGVLYFCFDNLLCILNIHVHGQFRILYRRLETICNVRTEDETYGIEKLEVDEKYIRNPCDSLEKLKDCIRQHQSLIEFVDRMEEVCTFMILGQVLMFSLLICVVSYQAFLVGGPFNRRIIFLVHSSGTFVQLLMFTLSCHDLWDGSTYVADAVYESGWYLLTENTKWTKRLRKNVMLIMMRAQRPCYLTAFGFFPITLETFKTIMSTAVSYLTLLRQGAM